MDTTTHTSQSQADAFLLFGKTTKPPINGKKREDHARCDCDRDDDLPEERHFLLQSRSHNDIRRAGTTTAERSHCGSPKRSTSSWKSWIGIIGIPNMMEHRDIKRRV